MSRAPIGTIKPYGSSARAAIRRQNRYLNGNGCAKPPRGSKAIPWRNLADYLEQFETNATRLGAHVHWARDAAEHNQIVLGILQHHGVSTLGQKQVDADGGVSSQPVSGAKRRRGRRYRPGRAHRAVGRRAAQPHCLAGHPQNKRGRGAVFHKHLHTEEGASDPKYLAEAARQHLRDRFLQADAGLTGVNFAVAETGGFVVCTNEGNADLGVSLPKLHIACMGIEKLIPRAATWACSCGCWRARRRASRSLRIRRIFTARVPGGELHIVLVDNGRSTILGRDEFRRSLNCIRCGACMNTCPVYRRSGGYSYAAVVPGPIGSILSPASNPAKHASLPFASSLCGSCTDVCPVKIDLHHQLLAWRRELAHHGQLAWSKRYAMKAASVVSALRDALPLGRRGRALD